MRTNPESIREFDKRQNMIGITRIESGKYDLFRNRTNYLEPHRRNYFVFFLVTSGFIQQNIDFSSVKAETGTLFFTTPGQVYFVEKAKRVAGIGLSVSAELLSKAELELSIIQNLKGINLVKLSKKDKSYLKDLMEKMFEEYSGHLPLHSNLLRSYLNTFLIYLSRIYVNQSSQQDVLGNSQIKVHQFKNLVEQEWNSLQQVSEFAKRLNISSKHLNHLVKSNTGKTVIEWIAQKRILEAKRLLLHTDQSAKEIAFALGFADPGYFNRFFKKYTGNSPLDFRSSIRKKYNTLSQ